MNLLVLLLLLAIVLNYGGGRIVPAYAGSVYYGPSFLALVVAVVVIWYALGRP